MSRGEYGECRGKARPLEQLFSLYASIRSFFKCEIVEGSWSHLFDLNYVLSCARDLQDGECIDEFPFGADAEGKQQQQTTHGGGIRCGRDLRHKNTHQELHCKENREITYWALNQDISLIRNSNN